MPDKERKKQIDAEWDRQYNLSLEQLNNLIAEKFERARMYHEAMKKREALFEESH